VGGGWGGGVGGGGMGGWICGGEGVRGRGVGEKHTLHREHGRHLRPGGGGRKLFQGKGKERPTGVHEEGWGEQEGKSEHSGQPIWRRGIATMSNIHWKKGGDDEDCKKNRRDKKNTKEKKQARRSAKTRGGGGEGGKGISGKTVVWKMRGAGSRNGWSGGELFVGGKR